MIAQGLFVGFTRSSLSNFCHIKGLIYNTFYNTREKRKEWCVRTPQKLFGVSGESPLVFCGFIFNLIGLWQVSSTHSCRFHHFFTQYATAPIILFNQWGNLKMLLHNMYVDCRHVLFRILFNPYTKIVQKL